MISPPIISTSTFVMVIRMLAVMCANCPTIAVQLLQQSKCLQNMNMFTEMFSVALHQVLTLLRHFKQIKVVFSMMRTYTCQRHSTKALIYLRFTQSVITCTVLTSLPSF